MWITGSSSLRYPVAVVWPSDELHDGWTTLTPEERDRIVVEHEEDFTRKILLSFQEAGRSENLRGFEIPARLVIATNDATPQSGLFTPTLKPRANMLKQYFKEQLDKVFSEEKVDLYLGNTTVVVKNEHNLEPNPLYACLPNLPTLPTIKELTAYVESLQLPHISLPRNLFVNLSRKSSQDKGSHRVVVDESSVGLEVVQESS
ncbi:hypothetical protein GEMRC1_006487 [Eukaryota sp. GEM-RC1]